MIYQKYSINSLVCVILLFAGSSSRSLAVTFLIGASSDTTLSIHNQLGSGNVPLGSNSQLYVIGTPGFTSSALVRFDLSAFSGLSITGNGWFTLSLYNFIDPFVTLDLRTITAPWNEESVTLNNFGNQFGPIVNNAIASQSNPYHRAGYRDFDFAIPASLIQNWIDAPNENFGLALVATGGRDIYFTSREFVPVGGAIGDWAPTLEFTFASIPEPSTAAFGVLASIAMLLRRSRIRRV